MTRFFQSLIGAVSAIFLISFSIRGAGAHELFVYRNDHNSRLVQISEKSPVTAVRAKTPHRQLNPEGSVSTFEGVEIAQVLGLTSKDRLKLVHFVAKDDYVSTIPASVLIDSKALLAFKENGKSLEDRRGGLQVVFPAEGAINIPEIYLKKAAFWCWYVKSIVIGDLDAVSPRSHKGPTLPVLQTRAFTFVPPSVFQVNPVECPKTVRVPMSKLYPQKLVSAEFLSGARRDLNPQDYDLVLAASQRPFPVHCGGPFALVESSKLKNDASQPLLAKNLLLNFVGAVEGK